MRVVWLPLAALLVFCGPRAHVGAEDDEAPYEVVEVAHGGTIEGICRLTEPVPVPVVDLTCCQDPCSQRARTADRVLFDPETLALADCLVTLRGIRSGKAWPEAMQGKEPHARVFLRDCRFVPHVQWVRRGTWLDIENEHGGMNDVNLHGYLGPALDNTVFNIAVAPGARLEDMLETHLQRPGHVVLRGDMRPFLDGHIFVSDHPYVAGPTGIDGAFVLEDVPEGTYDLEAWHAGMKVTYEHSPHGRPFPFGEDLVLHRRVIVRPGWVTRLELAFDAR